MKVPLFVCCVGQIALLFAIGVARAEDWPQWRGPNRDGLWRESGILETIPASGLKVRWRAKVGNGYSGPVVAQGRVFVTNHQLWDLATGKERVTLRAPLKYSFEIFDPRHL